MEAVEQAASLAPDVIVMDVNMPRMNGYEATRQILAERPIPIVMASASLPVREMETTFAALEAGALAVVSKPAGPGDPAHDAMARRLVTTVKLMSEVTVVRRWPRRDRLQRLPPPAHSRQRKIDVVAIAASTGGPTVITEILVPLAAQLTPAICIVQHMSPGFMPGFVEWLSRRTGLPVKLAEAGEPLLPGHVYLAPDGSQMGIAVGGKIELHPGLPANGFCPSGSYLLASVAQRYGKAAIGIVLTGMGSDGSEGLLKLRQAGGVTIAQEAGSCAVFGMPKTAIALGAAEHVLPPAAIAALIHNTVL